MTPEFTLVGSFQYSAEAHICRAKLEDAGIPAFLRDDITIDSDPLMSQAIGGVKLMVRTIDLEDARNVLNDVEMYSQTDDGKPLACPHCGSHAVEMVTVVDSIGSAIKFAIVSLAGLFPILRHRYRCNDCKTAFEWPGTRQSLGFHGRALSKSTTNRLFSAS